MTALELAREVFPGKTDEDLDYVLWNRTGFPAFWPARFKTPETALRAQLKAYRRAVTTLPAGDRLCDFCNRRAVPGETLCKRCAWILDREHGDG